MSVCRTKNGVVTIVAILFWSGPALAGVNLFSDTFDRADDDDIQASESGMSSDIISPLTPIYSDFRGSFGTAETAIVDGRLELAIGSGQTIVGLNHNFVDQEILDSGGFSLSARVEPKTGGDNEDDTERFLAIAVGLTESTATMPSDEDEDLFTTADRQLLEQGAFTLTIENDGVYNIYDSYYFEVEGDIANATHDEASINNVPIDFIEQVSSLTSTTDEYSLRLEFRFDDFAAGSNVLASAFIEGEQIDLDPTDIGNLVYTFQWHESMTNYIAFEGRAQTSSALDDLVIEALGVALPGDFDGSGTLDEHDVNGLLAAIQSGDGDAEFDLNGDETVDAADLSTWVTSLRKTWIGDANLDGEFNSADFVEVFTAGEYEDQLSGNSDWTTGDWNADGDFTSSDFVAAFADGGFEIGPRPIRSAVPEPNSVLVLAAGLALAPFARQRKHELIGKLQVGWCHPPSPRPHPLGGATHRHQ